MMTTLPHPATLGLYLSIPFCKAKCTFCNFASDVAPAQSGPDPLARYVDHLRHEIRSTPSRARTLNAHLPPTVDTLYFGGGTPSLLTPTHLQQIFADLRDTFRIGPNAEITLEAAPGQIPDATLDELQRQGINRISLGIQSFHDRETSAIGRLHTRRTCLDEIARLQRAGFPEISIDLIAGLPHQTEASWRQSLDDALSTNVPHVSIYMLEIDDDSRLGHEILSGGPRFHAPAVPSDDQSAALYEIACDTLAAAGLNQYEISNFSRPGHHSRHNLKYWHRQPYLGLGLDAHSMLPTPAGDLRFANPASLDLYLPNPATAFPLHTPPPQPEFIDTTAALEETLFLGLRLNAGISLPDLRTRFGDTLLTSILPALSETLAAGLLEQVGDRLRLTPRGRMVSNEVFSRLLLPTAA